MSTAATLGIQEQRTNTGAIAIIGALFFIFGFVTWLNGPLIGFVQLAFELSVVKAFLVTFVFYLSYFVFALPASAILDRTGMKKGMALGLMVMAVGAAAFGEFCVRRWYPGALVLHGMDNLSEQVAAADEAGKAALLDAFAARVHVPYLVMAGVLAVLGVAILYSPLPDLRSEQDAAADAGDDSLFNHPHVWLGALAIFACVGTEVMAGKSAVRDVAKVFGLPPDQTKFLTSATLTMMLAGYIVGFLAIPRLVSQQAFLKWSALLGVLLTVGAYLTTGYVSVAFVAALGFANAMMWPAIFPLAIHGLGKLIERGSALLIMGIAGGAIVPQLFALLKDSMDFQLVFMLLMVPCYLYILYFAVRGHRVARRG